MKSAVWVVFRDLARAGFLLGGVGLTAIGVSGGVAEAFGRVFSERFVAGDPSGVSYTSDRCAEFLEYAPHARNCADAATTHHFGEVVEYRVAAGVLGLVALAIWFWVLRRRGEPTVLPPAFEVTIATALFGVAAAGLLLESFGLAVIGGQSNGVGALLSAGIVSTVAASLAGAALFRTLLGRANTLVGPGSNPHV